MCERAISALQRKIINILQIFSKSIIVGSPKRTQQMLFEKSIYMVICRPVTYITLAWSEGYREIICNTFIKPSEKNLMQITSCKKDAENQVQNHEIKHLRTRYVNNKRPGCCLCFGGSWHFGVYFLGRRGHCIGCLETSICPRARFFAWWRWRDTRFLEWKRFNCWWIRSLN